MTFFKAAKMKKTLFVGAAVMAAAASGLAYAAGGGGTGNYKMEHVHWHFKGAMGTYDKAAAQRGYQVYREVCASCHALEHLSFRHLGDKGAPFYNPDFPNPNDNIIVKNFAADWQIEDIDSDTGDIIERPGVPADDFPDIYPNAAAAAGSNGGAIPPDLSVIVAARGGGADYLYNLLMAYDTPKPDYVELTPGLHYNPVFEGHKIAMANPLSDDLVEYADGTPATTKQMALDVTEFLAWSADPKLEQRKGAGLMTMVYLSLLALMLWLSYKRVWRDVEH